MYELMLTEQRLATYPPALRELMHHDLIEVIDLNWLYKKDNGFPLVIYQPDSVFSGDYEVDTLYGTLSYLPAFFFDHQILNRDETEMMVRIVLDEATESERDQVKRKLAVHDTQDTVHFLKMSTNVALVSAMKDLFYSWREDDLPKGTFYDLFEDAEMDYKMCEFLPEHVKLRDDLLRISYLSFEFEDSGCRNMVIYFTDSYENQLQVAKEESGTHTTYGLVYKEYQADYLPEGSDVLCRIVNPLRGGGFSCTN